MDSTYTTRTHRDQCFAFVLSTFFTPVPQFWFEISVQLHELYFFRRDLFGRRPIFQILSNYKLPFDVSSTC